MWFLLNGLSGRGRVFENLLGQSVSAQFVQDIKAGVLAPAMLFSGPPASGKGTAALELARILSCEAGPETARALWGCSCSSCSRHRLLVHPDLLCLGWKPFFAEIAASAGAFLREAGNASSRLLFIRSVRKLLARFNPVLWEDDPKGKIISPLVNSVEEGLDDLNSLANNRTDNLPGNQEPESRLVEGIIKNALKLESEGVSSAIPIGQLRRAAFWSRTAPQGREKLIVLENADRMQEGARNSLLKLLEEPPAYSRYVLCTSRPGGLPATVLSRLRPYRFIARDAATEADVVRRVFRDKCGEGGIGAYLESFLSVSPDALDALAAFFAASVACRAALLSKKPGRSLSDEAVFLGRANAPKAEAAGLGKPKGESAAVVALVLEKTEKFEMRSLFSRFLFSLLEQVSAGRGNFAGTGTIAFRPEYFDIWRTCVNWAENAGGIYNIKPAQVLEKLFNDLSRGMAEL